MKKENGRKDKSVDKGANEGVSEILGELLLLVVVVLMATVFASYATSYIPPLKNVPQARIVGYTNRSNYTLTIQFGESLPLHSLCIAVTYNYSSNPKTLYFTYSHTSGNVAVFTAGSNEAWLFLRPGYYNESWSFGEKLNIPREGNCTLIEVLCDNSLISRLHFPGG